MALSYSDQHLAWQQRIGKEMTAASRVSSLYHSRTSSAKRRPKSTFKSSSIDYNAHLLPRSRQYNNLQQINVYAEVRGKYARAAPALKCIPVSTEILAPKENSLVSRPATAGSLVRTKSAQRAYKGKQEKSREVDAVSLISKRSLPAERVATQSRRVHQSVKGTNSPMVVEKIEEAGECEEGLGEEVPEDSSEVTWVTTSSYKQYVTELEEMLREERMKRIKAEQALQHASDAASRKH